MGYGRDSKSYTILDAAAATGKGLSAFAKDFRNAIFSFDSASNGNLTVKFAGSLSVAAPDFDATRSPSNQWDYIQVIDLEDGSAIDGDTGIVLTGTDDNRQVEANINGLNWVTAIVTARSAGNITVKVVLYEN